MEFINQLENNNFLTSIVEAQGFSKVESLLGQYTKHWDNHYSFQQILIGEMVIKKLEIRISPNGIFMTFLMDSSDVYDDPIRYFGNKGITIKREPFDSNEQEIEEFRRKLGVFQIWGRSARLSVLKSDSYGIMIKVTLIN